MKPKCAGLKRDMRPRRVFLEGEKESWISLLDQTSEQHTAEDWAARIGIGLNTLHHWTLDYGWRFKEIPAEEISRRIRQGLEGSEQWEAVKRKKRGSPRVKCIDSRRQRIKKRLLQGPATLGELAKLVGATKPTARSLARSIGAVGTLQLERNVAGKLSWISIWTWPTKKALVDDAKNQGSIAAK
jgi:hypothetical protein